MSDVERGIKVASLPLAEALDKVFGTPGTFVRLRSVALTRDYEEYFGQVVELEQQAHRIDAWELGIPGLLQTEDYARELARVTQHAAPDHEVERIVAARNQRQQMLHTDQAPRLWYVLDEGAIRRIVGGITVMTAQLGRLLDVAALPGNYVQVLPFATGGGIGIGGPVTVFQFQNRDPVAYTESNRGGRLAEDRQEVSARMDELSVIRVNALAPRPSAQLIREAMEDLNGQLAQEQLQLWQLGQLRRGGDWRRRARPRHHGPRRRDAQRSGRRMVRVCRDDPLERRSPGRPVVQGFLLGPKGRGLSTSNALRSPFAVQTRAAADVDEDMRAPRNVTVS